MANWGLSSAFFEYLTAVRKVMYTTNTVEGYHRELRKVTKTKGAFSSDVALQKLVYLVIQNLETKWETKTYNWKEVTGLFHKNLSSSSTINYIFSVCRTIFPVSP